MTFDTTNAPTPPTPETAAGSLQDLVLDSGDVEKFLANLSELAVARLSSPGNDVLCGITLLRPRKVETVASSSEDAKKFDELQYSFGDGPCLTAAHPRHPPGSPVAGIPGRYR